MTPLVVAFAAVLVMTACQAGQEASPSVVSSTTAAPSASPMEPSTEPSPSPSARPSPSAEAGPNEPPALAWDDAEPFDGRPNAMLFDNGTWIIGGWATTNGPAAWTSSDARTWSSADVPDPLPPTDEPFLGAGLGPMVRLGDTLLSYGTAIGCCDGRGVLGWRSADGTSWEVIESSSPLFEQGYLVSDLALGDPALIAIERQFGAWSGRIWRWTEDSSWVDVTPPTETADEFATGLEASDVVWSQDRFVVVGVVGDPGTGAGAGASWVSTDGESWEQSPSQDALADIVLTHVAPRPDGGFLALGQDDVANYGRAGRTVAFVSPDGLEWTAVDAPGEAESRPEALLPVDGGFVAFIAAGAGTEAWTSGDGTAWTSARTLGNGFVDAVTDGSTLLVATVKLTEGLEDAFFIHRATVEP